jgi:hypothetical protein
MRGVTNRIANGKSTAPTSSGERHAEVAAKAIRATIKNGNAVVREGKDAGRAAKMQPVQVAGRRSGRGSPDCRLSSSSGRHSLHTVVGYFDRGLGPRWSAAMDLAKPIAAVDCPLPLA